MPPFRSLFFLLYSMLFGALLYLAILVTAYEYADVKALEEVVYCEWGFYQYDIALTEAGFGLYKTIVYASFGALAFLLLLSPELRNTLKREWRVFRSEVKQALLSAKQRIGRLTRKQWLLVLSTMGVTAVIKLCFLLNYPLHTDETATYDYFVMEGIEAVTGYYPIPNNHVFQNVLNWISYQVSQDFFFSVRGPSYLIGTLGLLVLFILVYFVTNFRTAVAFALMISVAYLPFYFSITGRGYSLLLILAGIGFICTYYIVSAEASFKRLPYLVLTISSILGLYTVPTYLYTFATYIVILFAASLIQKQYTRLFFSAGVCGVVGFTTAVLYSPIIVVSGVKALFGNTYVTPQGTAEVLAGLTSYFVALEGSIVGQDRFGFTIAILVILLTISLFFTDILSQKKKLLCMMALTGMLVPYIFFLLQSILPPDRTMAYKSFYFFLLVAIIADAIINYQIRYKRAAVLGFVMVLSGYAIYEVSISYRVMKRLQPAEEQMQYIWERVSLRTPSSMYITDPFYQLYFLHYSKVSGREISFYSDFEEGKTYDVLILGTDAALPQHVLQNYSSIYNDNKLTVYINSDNSSLL